MGAIAIPFRSAIIHAVVYDFDGCTTPLFRKGGLSKRKNGYKIVGIPLVDVRA